MIASQRWRVLAAATLSYVVLAGILAWADIWLTTYLLEHDVDAFEANLKIDASGFSSLLGGASRSLALATGLFAASLAACTANERQRKFLQISSWLDEVFIRIPGAASVWYVIMLAGAVMNNLGMILFQFSWLQEAFALVGFETADEQMAGFALFTLISFAILIVPSYFLFSTIVRGAKRMNIKGSQPSLAQSKHLSI